MNILPCSDELSLAPTLTFDMTFSAALRMAIIGATAEPNDSPAELLAELDCAVTYLALSALGRQA